MSTDLPPVRVWDAPTRLFHWVLVVLIALQFATAEWGLLSMEWHYRFGYATLALILFRLGWGFVGSQTSRFAEFVRGPVAVAHYLKRQGVDQNAGAKPGHNPLGGWSVLVMLVCVGMQALTGLFASDGIDEDGPYVDAVSGATVKWMTRLHHLGETALLILIVVHIAAIVLYRVIKHDDLVTPMLTGQKPMPGPAPTFVSGWRALAVFAVAVAAVAALAWFGA